MVGEALFYLLKYNLMESELTPKTHYKVCTISIKQILGKTPNMILIRKLVRGQVHRHIL